jgi:regulator of nucleoside diphosphate kinase
MTDARPLILTRTDHDRLERLIEQHSEGRNAELAELLEQELARAEIRAVAPPDVVTMNSHVVFEDEETGARREVYLCYPHEVAAGEGRVSVLAPIGSALIGLSVGQTIEWPVPNGTKRLRIVAVPRAEHGEAVHAD